ncbi:hypothetical protein LWI29_029460 [Acer saccharum]|uniref:Uncharacterized protein n=1 Tax=Acer saccharum TaxID=4024 RepID=A0AA39TA09_ACESA|nr:hypothetical protein LWI29_029460 [Acer saccharum]
MIADDWLCDIVHVIREGNMLVNSLARLGHDMDIGMLVLEEFWKLMLEVRDFCKECTADKNEEPKDTEEQNVASCSRNKVNEVDRGSYGPRMQVSYGRINRNHMGFNAAGKKYGNQGNDGKQGYGDRQGSGYSSGGSVKHGTGEGNRKGAEICKIPLKVTQVRKNGKLDSKVVVGSRFAILNENLDEEVIIEKNGIEGWTKKSSKGTKKKSQQPITISAQPKEDIEDAEVLQNLHKKMVEIRVAESQQPSTIDQPPSVVLPSDAHEQQQVVVSDVSSFEVVASKLKKAIEIVLE